MGQSARNISYENVKIGEENHSFSTNADSFPEVNEMIRELFPKWKKWQQSQTPHMKVGKADFYRFALIRGIIATKSQIEQKPNVAV